MITEDYVSFETAELLKEKGFEEECVYFYDWDEEDKIYRICSNGGSCNEARFPSYYSMPTLQMVMKWLREVHDIDVSVVPLRSHKEYLPRIEGDITSHDDIPCRKYEEAAEVAIKYCLEHLI